MEAIWNYFYWQALGTNALDDVGHVLRLGVIDPTGCVSYVNKPRATTLKNCNQFLGPTQPGVTTPDPTRLVRGRRRAAPALRRLAAAPAPATTPRRPASSTTCSAP